ncbi:MAG: hypothetical protein ACPLZD_04005 [Candidatus Saccharicenans sp.]|nr:MAG: hypothetical protein C0168_06275 [Candidatus Aminicenantes bacterium]HEK86670.1 hypothetical protein [Candidatus Aminicenantes bacterium]
MKNQLHKCLPLECIRDRNFSFQRRRYKLRELASDKITVALIPKKKLYVLKNNRKVAEFPI